MIPGKHKAAPRPREERISQQGPELDLDERIRRRAHAIYLERGGQAGSDVDDWLQAEHEIMNEQEPETSDTGD